MTTREEQQDASDEVIEVAPDILRMQLPISLPGLGHVNCYALCDERGLAIVDPGLPGRETHDVLLSRLASAGYRLEHVHTVIVTHSHPDHFGGAGVVRVEVGADVLTHEAFRTWMDPAEPVDIDPDALDDLDSDDAARRQGPQFRHPWTIEQPWGGGSFRPPIEEMEKRMAEMESDPWIQPPMPNVRVAHDEIVTFARREWVAVHTPGHTSDHLCLYSPTDGVVLTGDHVLPTITPHISGLVAGADPLSQFFASLDGVAALPGTTLGLPAHGHPFVDIPGRTEAIKEHHEDRLDKLRRASEAIGEAPVVELSHHLFAERSWGPMAESETYAHLEHLRHAGAMTHRRVDGDLHYRVVDA